MQKTLRILSNLLKIHLAYVRWGTLSSTDSELIVATSWKMVWTANYLRSSKKHSRDTITLDQTMEKSST